METTTVPAMNQSNVTTNALGPSKKARVTGWIMGILPSLLLLMSGVMKLMPNKQLTDGFAHLGWPLGAAVTLGIVELTCTILYLIPQTAVLGAILLTGYLGGAIASTARVGDAFIPAAVMGVMLWGGLFLRDPRLRQLIPFRARQ